MVACVPPGDARRRCAADDQSRNPSVETAINLVPIKPLKKEIDIALSNSFGFGGTNASLIFRKVA